MAKVYVTDVKWLCASNTGLMRNDQGVLYISPVVGLGMTYPYSKSKGYVGMDPRNVPSKRYAGNKAEDSYGRVVVYQQDIQERIVWDDKIRARIHELHSHNPDAVPFDAYNKINNPAPSGNNEALVNFDFSDDSPHWDILYRIIKEIFGLAPETDLRDPWIPRDAGTPYGQDLMVDELADKLVRHSHVGFNGHTGLAKTMIVAGVLLGKVFPTSGAFILFTSPIGDTLDDVEKNFCGYHYPGSDRSRKVVVYQENSLSKKSFADMRKEADTGTVVIFAATVQDIRYQDDPSSDNKELREKYQDLLSIKIDAYARDEVQTNYGGAVTSEVLGQVASKATWVVDTSASLNKLVDLYHPDAIVDRGLFWALQYEKERGTPHIHIESLSGLAYDTLDPSVKDIYSEEEGWTPTKMTEHLPNGQLRSLIAIDYIWEQQYINTDDKEDNLFSIINDLDLPYQSRRVGIHIMPEGVKGTPAKDYLIQLANDANSMPKWNNGKAIFITPYDYIKHVRFDNRKNYKEVIEDLLKEFEHVIILTHRMWTVGSNIPQLAHFVQWDPIRDPYNQEQAFPGRCYRTQDWKNDIKCYDLAPGHTLETSFSHLAKVTAKLNRTNPDPKELLKNISIKHYVKGLGVISHSVEEVYGAYNNNLLNKVKATPPVDKIALALGATDMVNLLSSNIDDNHELGKGSQTELTEDTNAKKFEWQDTNGKGGNKGQPKTVGPLALAKKINSVMLELPAFAVLNKLFLIEDALSHWAVKKMFGQDNVDLLLDIIENNSLLKNIMQDWLTDIHQAYQSLPFEELHDYVFKNTKKKKETGLVFIDNNSAEYLTKEFIKIINPPKDYNGIIVVVNALSGSWPYYLQKYFKDAKIVCIETHEYYIDHLRSMGFDVISNKDLENKKYMTKIKYWLLNPPYQKDAEGQNDESNKQGSFWFEFVKEIATTPARTDDAKALVVSPKSIFGAGGFGRSTYKVNQIREHAEFAHIWPDLSSYFPGIGIEIGGYVIDFEKTNTDVTVDGFQETITVDGNVPTPFHVSVTASKVLKNCWSDPNINFLESINANDNDIVLKVNGGRYKLWKKTFVGFNKDTEHSQQGAIIDVTEILGYQSAIKSKLWEYIFKILGGEKGNSVTGLMKYMPIMPDMTKSYTDTDWFAAFNITLEMQKDIDRYLKDYK